MTASAVHLPFSPRDPECVRVGQLDLVEPGRGLVVLAVCGGMPPGATERLRDGFLAHGLSTLELDLLCPTTSLDRSLLFDVERHARGIREATRAARSRPPVDGLPTGYFGHGMAAAAALLAVASEPGSAVVSAGGRPDLAGPALAQVAAPTLLIVSGRDGPLLSLNRLALGRLRGERELVTLEPAPQLFADADTTASVAALAADWFLRHLAAAG